MEGFADPHRTDQKSQTRGHVGCCIRGALLSTQALDRNGVPRPRPWATEQSEGAEERVVETPDIGNGHRPEVFHAHGCTLSYTHFLSTEWRCRLSSWTHQSASPLPHPPRIVNTDLENQKGSDSTDGEHQGAPPGHSARELGPLGRAPGRASLGQCHREGLRLPRVAVGSPQQDQPDSTGRRPPSPRGFVGGSRRAPCCAGFSRHAAIRGWSLRGSRGHRPITGNTCQARPLPFLGLPWLRAEGRAVRA